MLEKTWERQIVEKKSLFFLQARVEVEQVEEADSRCS